VRITGHSSRTHAQARHTVCKQGTHTPNADDVHGIDSIDNLVESSSGATRLLILLLPCPRLVKLLNQLQDASAHLRRERSASRCTVMLIAMVNKRVHKSAPTCNASALSESLPQLENYTSQAPILRVKSQRKKENNGNAILPFDRDERATSRRLPGAASPTRRPQHSQSQRPPADDRCTQRGSCSEQDKTCQLGTRK
jgi:hypothetical protein